MMHKIRKWLGLQKDNGDNPETTDGFQSDTSSFSGSVIEKHLKPYEEIIPTDAVEKWIRDHVQIKPEDCLGCKIVATMTITFILATVASQLPKLNSKMPNQVRRPMTAVQYSAMGFGYAWWIQSQWYYDTKSDHHAHSSEET